MIARALRLEDLRTPYSLQIRVIEESCLTSYSIHGSSGVRESNELPNHHQKMINERRSLKNGYEGGPLGPFGPFSFNRVT